MPHVNCLFSSQSHIHCCHRLTGQAKFQLDMLARHGDLVVIPHDDITAERVQEELEAATGQPLHEAFVSSAQAQGAGIWTPLPAQKSSCI